MIAVIPLRSQSKRIRNKNIKLLWGKPLFYWSIKAASLSKSIKQIIVATDSEKYIKLIKSFKFKNIFFYKRSERSSKANSKSEYVLKECILSQKKFADYFFLIQVTNPFLKSKDIDKAYSYFKKKKYDSLLSVVPFNRFIWSKSKPINYSLNKRPMSQQLDFYLENGSFYIIKTKNIIKGKNRLSGKIGMYKMKINSVFEIDELEDFKICKKLG